MATGHELLYALCAVSGPCGLPNVDPMRGCGFSAILQQFRSNFAAISQQAGRKSGQVFDAALKTLLLSQVFEGNFSQ
ncbi:hypothetical protein [Pseudoduganella chitinolytica]|uniref:Uncharacterized protein n=1 Tax=Pseudoduganella chitinolytica TaxID=34070 RepID=A0ABY8BGJ5_9BURK|nr:hypothetical protein [Pseudoduganella chitinolytica]WEF33832.1 hypothetical protein PX653_03350 [Pseudoduganella chitinolytica]